MDLISSIHTNLHLNDNHAPVDRLTSEVLHTALDHTAPYQSGEGVNWTVLGGIVRRDEA